MIRLTNITKSYRTEHGRHYVFKDVTATFPDNVSIGILGRNGSGKSTLVRLLGGIEPPDHGEIFIDKSLSWPVGLATGFLGSMTGRDNVKFICRIHGDSHKEMLGRVAYVERFAEIGDYFDMPMNTYSSGMKTRVTFGTSMAFDFDYYLVDEVLAVGDPFFKQKASEIFKEKRSKANIILVSHSLKEIKESCDVGIYVGGGQLVICEDINDAIELYRET